MKCWFFKILPFFYLLSIPKYLYNLFKIPLNLLKILNPAWIRTKNKTFSTQKFRQKSKSLKQRLNKEITPIFIFKIGLGLPGEPSTSTQDIFCRVWPSIFVPVRSPWRKWPFGTKYQFHPFGPSTLILASTYNDNPTNLWKSLGTSKYANRLQ